jgi:hypothetical protein
MAKVELNAVEEAKWHVAQAIRDINACMNFKMLPFYRAMLADWQERLFYAEFTDCDYSEMMQSKPTSVVKP